MVNQKWLPPNVFFLSRLDEPWYSLWSGQWDEDDDRTVLKACHLLLEGRLDG